MPVLTVEKSIVIVAPCGDVYSLVRDFTKWKAWSPWLVAEPDAKLDCSTNPDAYSWNGKVTGSGRMERVAEQSGKSIDCKLSFFKPWKSESSVRFEFCDTGQGIEVKWTMKGSLLYFMFFMKPMMAVMIGMDYERGLKLLADLAEKGGDSLVAGVFRREDVSRLSPCRRWFEESGTKPAGAPFAPYGKWHAARGLVG